MIMGDFNINLMNYNGISTGNFLGRMLSQSFLPYITTSTRNTNTLNNNT